MSVIHSLSEMMQHWSRKRRTNRAGKARQTGRRRLQFECMEPRVLLRGVTLADGVLKIDAGAGNYENTVYVYELGDGRNTGTLSSSVQGGATPPKEIPWNYAASAVKRIVFVGGPKDDFFCNVSSKPSVAYGKNGNDYLSGGKGNDRLFGDAGTDTLVGGNGIDALYGGNDANADLLYGDAVLGTSDSDRFLIRSGSNDVIKDNATRKKKDATVWFENGKEKWTDEDIEAVDEGLKLLHEETRNSSLLLARDGKAMKLHRETSIVTKEGSILGENDHQGVIRFTDLAMQRSKAANVTKLVTIHEFAHNWDGLSEWYTNSNDKQVKDWFALSGWQLRTTDKLPPGYAASGDGIWIYKIKDPNDPTKNTAFAREYGKRNPWDDWCTAWESYFIDKYRLTKVSWATNGKADVNKTLPPAKQAHLVKFFQGLL
jgi:hypothetical protein